MTQFSFNAYDSSSGDTQISRAKVADTDKVGCEK
jgi:hypothetical protein